jgi:hypothetical protein
LRTFDRTVPSCCFKCFKDAQPTSREAIAA